MLGSLFVVLGICTNSIYVWYLHGCAVCVLLFQAIDVMREPGWLALLARRRACLYEAHSQNEAATPLHRTPLRGAP